MKHTLTLLAALLLAPLAALHAAAASLPTGLARNVRSHEFPIEFFV
jgi:hypothetical protein